MKYTNKTIFINSFIIALIFSFMTIYIIYPQLNSILYTSINSWSNLNLSLWFFLKILVILLLQTSVLWVVFYIIAKKIFLKHNQ